MMSPRSIVIGRLYGDVTVQELRREDGVYVTRTFVLEDDSRREVSVREAMEWVDAMHRYGGTVYREIQPRPENATSEGTTA